MKLECVTVCVNFSDVLAFSLPLNKCLFDRMVVVSDANDEATKNLCSHHHVELVQTSSFYDRDHAFNKGNGINAGLKALSCDGWVLHMDADIVLPPRTRELLERADLDPDVIYGIDRMMCPSFEAWMRYFQSPTLQHTAQTFVIPEPFRMGVRVARLTEDGYLPIGFFQLWNAAQTGIRDYPREHGTAGRTDMLHAMRWPRRKRALLPEIVGVHLEGPQAPGQKNWRGRTMQWFGPAPAQLPRSAMHFGADASG